MRNQKGFGLIEVLIAVGILSFVMLGTATAINNAMLVSQTADQKANLTSIVSSTMGTAFNQTTCTLAVTDISQKINETFHFGTLQVGANLAGYNLTVKSVSYANPVLIATGFDGTKVYYGTITLSATSNRLIYGGQDFAPRTIAAVYMSADPLGTITECGPVLPTLPTAPTPPPVDNTAFNKACASIGGTVSGTACTFPANNDRGGSDNGVGNGGEDNGEHNGNH